MFLAERNVISDTYFPGDLGIQSNFDFVNNGVLVGYIFYVPKGIYRTWSNKLKVDYSYSYRTNKNTESYYNFVSEMLYGLLILKVDLHQIKMPIISKVVSIDRFTLCHVNIIVTCKL